jgi:hypothetical protein
MGRQYDVVVRARADIMIYGLRPSDFELATARARNTIRVPATPKQVGLICMHLNPNPTPYLHPTPCDLHLAPCTLHPTPYTPHPTPYTLHPAPCTLHPARYIGEVVLTCVHARAHDLRLHE